MSRFQDHLAASTAGIALSACMGMPHPQTPTTQNPERWEEVFAEPQAPTRWLRNQTEDALDEIFDTEEGKECLAKIASTIHDNKLIPIHVTTSIDDPFVHIRFHRDEEDKPIGVKHIELSNNSGLEYRGIDGNYHDFSILHAAVHEIIGHACAMSTDEQEATRITNRFLGPEVLDTGEAPRGDYYDTRPKGGGRSR